MIKEIAKVVVVLLLATPFVYMFYDVSLDIFKRVTRSTKPVLVNVFNSFIK